MKLSKHSYQYVESVAEFYKFQTTCQRLVVIYSASWCGPCKILKEWLDKDYADYPHPILVLDVDNIALEPLVENVEGMPTIEFVEDKTVIQKVVGLRHNELKITFDRWKEEASVASQEKPE
jgi:thiol-disulfide isomerase/thioredoxin